MFLNKHLHLTIFFIIQPFHQVVINTFSTDRLALADALLGDSTLAMEHSWYSIVKLDSKEALPLAQS